MWIKDEGLSGLYNTNMIERIYIKKSGGQYHLFAVTASGTQFTVSSHGTESDARNGMEAVFFKLTASDPPTLSSPSQTIEPMPDDSVKKRK